MDSLTIAAASGLRSRMESLSLLANNLANAATSGYKSDREFYGLYTSIEAAPGEEGVLTTLPVVQRQWTDFSQGTVETTGNVLDVALSGRGFLTAKGPGGPAYTRNGNLHISPSGELVTSEGFPLFAVGGSTIRVTGGTPVEITKDGTVIQEGRTLGQFAIVDFKSTAELEKMNGTCFRNPDPENAPVAAANVEVQQGRLESSNVGVPDAAIRLVGVMRQFEMLHKAVSIGVDLNRKAIEEIARVSA